MDISLVQSLAVVMPCGLGAKRPANSMLPVFTRSSEAFSQVQPPCIAVLTITAGNDSTATQGGCTCENASLLRVDTGNVEFAALFAPKPQGMTTANDWTREMAAKGFPELQQLYKLAGAPKNVMLQRGEHFPHNYNAVTRSAFYTWLNRHFKLGLKEPVIERDYEPLTRSSSPFGTRNTRPEGGGPRLRARLLKWFAADAEKQLAPPRPRPTRCAR